MGRRSSGKPSAKHGSAGRADCLPRGKPFGAPAGAYSLPQEGNDAPTTARIGTCRPMGRSHFSFDGERKVCKRKPAARRLQRRPAPLSRRGLRSCGSPTGCPRPRFAALTRREKALYCPFWRRGSLCRAQHDWPDFTCDPARSELAFFCRQNGRAFFPPLPIAALAPRGRRRAYLTLAG